MLLNRLYSKFLVSNYLISDIHFPMAFFENKGSFWYYDAVMNNQLLLLTSEVYGLSVYDYDEYDITKPLVWIKQEPVTLVKFTQF